MALGLLGCSTKNDTEMFSSPIDVFVLSYLVCVMITFNKTAMNSDVVKFTIWKEETLEN